MLNKWKILSPFLPLRHIWQRYEVGMCWGLVVGVLGRWTSVLLFYLLVHHQPNTTQCLRNHCYWDKLSGPTDWDERQRKTITLQKGRGSTRARGSSGECDWDRECKWCIASAMMFVTEFLTRFYWLVTLRYVGKPAAEKLCRLLSYLVLYTAFLL